MLAITLTKQRHLLADAVGSIFWNTVVCQRVPAGTRNVAMTKMYSNKVINKTSL